MEPRLRNRARLWHQIDDDAKANLVFDIWIYYLRLNDKSHFEALDDLLWNLAGFEEEEEYEICAALQETIENYQQLSRIKIQ